MFFIFTTQTKLDYISFNPGRIDPTNRAWNATRKPLVAAWNMHSGAQLYTINVHLSSKGGSSSTQGDARTPFNSALDARTNQLASVAVRNQLHASHIIPHDLPVFGRRLFNPY